MLKIFTGEETTRQEQKEKMAFSPKTFRPRFSVVLNPPNVRTAAKNGKSVWGLFFGLAVQTFLALVTCWPSQAPDHRMRGGVPGQGA